MKVRTSLKALKQKPGSSVVRRDGRVLVINKQNPQWKARQG
jgi:large subunit ribosomal protein L36